MDLGLKGRHTVIIGGSSGIGKATAHTFAAEGANLTLVARGMEALEAVASDVEKAHGVKALPVSADLLNSEQVNAALEQAVGELGIVHVLVYTPGLRMQRMDRQLEWGDEEWLNDLDIKVVGLLRVLRALDPHLATDGTGSIVTVTGVAGKTVLGLALTHGIVNSGIIHATGYLARDLASKNVRVNSVSPGIVGTEWRVGWRKMMAEKQGVSEEAFLAEYMRGTGSLSVTWATSEQVADAIAFVASDRASYINGAVIPVDAGWETNPR